MKLQLFGREAEIRTEAVVIAISALALIGMLVGYLFFRDTGDIIIEAGGERRENESVGGAQVAGSGGAVLTNVIEGSGQNTSPGRNEGDAANGTVLTEPQKDSPAVNDNENGKAATIKIYVVGCVNKPGIVTLEKGMMICDAVREAGGLTENADSDNINMVYSLNENVMLHIKSRQDEKTGLGKGADVISDSGTGAEVIGKGDDTAAGGGRNAPVNLNTAGADELDTLPGIGEATAGEIIAYRDKYGGFSCIEDIMKVPRIKENRFESIKEYITVD